MNPGDVANDAAYDVAVDAKGRIVVAGYSALTSGAADFAVARYNADGTLDQSFGNAGKLVVDVVGDQVSDTAAAVAVDGQGRIVVVGTSWRTGGFLRKIAIFRLTEAGTLDAAFGAGKVLLDFGEAQPNYIVADAVVDAADRVIVLSQAAGPAGDYDFGLTAVKDDGTLDASFGSSRRVFTDFTKAWCGDTPCPRSADFPVALAIDGQGRLVVGGNTQIGSIHSNLALARYHADGTLDTTFISSVPSLQYQPGLIISDLAIGSDTNSFDFLYAIDLQDTSSRVRNSVSKAAARDTCRS